MRANDMILISVDDHIVEPPDMFDAHVPAKYRDLAPRIVNESDGQQRWWYGNLKGRNLGLNAVAGKPREFFNVDIGTFDEMRPGCFDVHERVRDMSAGGQLAGLNFPNFPGFAGQVLNQGPDRAVNLAMIRGYNDWHIEEWCGAYPDRFIPCGLVPLWDADVAAAEIRRLASKGCHAVAFSENPEALNLPSIHSGYWDPAFTAASDEGTVLCLHLGSSSRMPPYSSDAPPLVPYVISPMGSASSFVEIVWSPMWKKFPDLEFSITEGDIGWMPYFLERSERVGQLHAAWAKPEWPDGMSGPIDVFKRHILCCFIWDPIGVELLNHFNIDNVCWESDFPHSESPWPNGPEYLESRLGELPDHILNKITYENAMRHYRFDPFTNRSRDQCTVGALRAEVPDVDTVTHVGHRASERDLASWLEVTGRRR